ncbi:MAG: Na+/H+ antiporter NhaC family protein [Bacteroidia bacterium]|nr:Na+/H+ antiporter NhaC family protein [Bacteroidia bacterium]
MNKKGLLSLTPLLVFLGVYLVTSLVIKDFYKVPVASAFLLASCYAILISRGRPLRERVASFSAGAADSKVLLMVWIFILAGAFAQTAKDIGAIEATVNLTLRLIPGSMLYAGLFFTACFISMSVGTSVGTIVALVPLASGIAVETGGSVPFMAAIVVGGSFFGDNLSFISDTTIAATQALGCQMRDKFRANIRIVAPAVLVVFVIYIVKGIGLDVEVPHEPVEWLKMLPYLLVLVLAFLGTDVLLILSLGIIVNFVIGLVTGTLGWSSWLASMGEGISGMGSLIIVTLLAGGMMELIRLGGGLDCIVDALTPKLGESGVTAREKRRAELSIAVLVSLANLCTANNTIAIITAGGVAKDVQERFGLDNKRVASILDTFSCFVQGLIPYGAQLLMASGLAGVGSAAIIGHLYYPFALGIVSLLAILLPLKQSRR